MGNVLTPKNTVTDFQSIWKQINLQNKLGLPVRRKFLCDCGFNADSHETLFLHTSGCPKPAYFAKWGNSLVIMPGAELTTLHFEWKSLLSDRSFANQLWDMAYSRAAQRICSVAFLKRKYFEIAKWYGLGEIEANSLWNSSQIGN